MRRRRRVTYRPSKGQAIFGAVVGVLMIVVALSTFLPVLSMGGSGPIGLFLLVWVLVAVGAVGMNLYRAFGGKYVGPEISIEDEAGPEGEGPSSPQARLEQLQSLYDRRLITQEEYEQKRQEILKEL